MTLLGTAYKDLSLKGNNRIDFKSLIFLQVPPKLAQRRQRGRLMDKLSIHSSERRQVAERGEMQKEKEQLCPLGCTWEMLRAFKSTSVIRAHSDYISSGPG